MYLGSLEKKECCGCTACSRICATGAIRMIFDDEGFLYPVKDASKCTSCGLCEKVCAFANPLYCNENPNVYAAYVKSVEHRIKSTSGGVFYVVAKNIIEQGGVVFGAILDEQMQVRHRASSTKKELLPLRGSKYVQSNLDKTYDEVKLLLNDGRKVYFTGTPCQVAGLNSFLRKKYDNLVTSDLVCHGVPSQKMFNWHLSYLERKNKGKIVDYKFREYDTGRCCETVHINVEQDLSNRSFRRQTRYELSPYLFSFMYAYTYRPSCYVCPFAKVPRQGDITLADFWNSVKYHPALDDSHGISLVLLNTEKGKKLWTEIQAELCYEESKLEFAARYNMNLVHPTKMPPERVGIYKTIEIEGYDKIAKTIFRPPNYLKVRIKSAILSIIGEKGKKILKQLLKYNK